MFSNQYITYMYIIIFNVKLSLHVTAHKFSNQANLMLNVYTCKEFPSTYKTLKPLWFFTPH